MTKRNLAWMLTLTAIALMVLVLLPQSARRDTLYAAYAPLAEIDALVRRHFAGPLERNELVDGAIRGLMGHLDPHSCYLSADELAAYRRRVAGVELGIGVELASVDDRVVVIGPVEGGPAFEAGLRAGDVILAVDGKSTEQARLPQVEQWLAGPEGEEVQIEVRSARSGQTSSLSMTRARLRVEAVKGYAWSRTGWRWFIDQDLLIAYIRVSAFREHTNLRLGEVLADLRERGMRGLILDLRFNPGGLVSEAVAVLDRFVAEGRLVSTFTRLGTPERYDATAAQTDTTTVLAVLISGASASAAEIVAGSLQDHARATLVGTRSFGKGSIQYLLELGKSDGALRLTSAYYHLPSGRSFEPLNAQGPSSAKGIAPDVRVELTADEQQAIIDGRINVDRAARSGASRDPSGRVSPNVVHDRQFIAALDLIRSRLAGTPSP